MLLQAQRHEDVWGSVSVSPCIYNFRTRYTRRKPASGNCRFRVTFLVPGKNWIGRSVSHNAQMDLVGKKKIPILVANLSKFPSSSSAQFNYHCDSGIPSIKQDYAYVYSLWKDVLYIKILFNLKIQFYWNMTPCLPVNSCCDMSSCRLVTHSTRIFITPSYELHNSRCLHLLSVHPLLPMSTGTAVAQWARFCATNRKVAGSIPTGVIGIFHWHKIFRSQYGPGVDSASNRNEYQEYFLGVKAAGA